MAISFTPPSNQKNFYTRGQHEAFVKLCDDQNLSETQRLSYAEHLNIGFGYVYMSALEKKLKYYQKNLDQDADKALRGDYVFWELHQRLNNSENSIREHLCKTMLPYLREKEGKVDCWPSPYYPQAFNIKLVSTSSWTEPGEEPTETRRVSDSAWLPFDYFGGPYTMETKHEYKKEYNIRDSKTHKTLDKEKGQSLRYAVTDYIRPMSGRYKDLYHKTWELDRKYEDAARDHQNHSSNVIKTILIFLPTLLTLLLGILMVWWSFTGTPTMEAAATKGPILSWIDSAWHSDSGLKILVCLPYILVQITLYYWAFIALFSSLFGMEKIVVSIGALVLLMAGVLLSAVLAERTIVSSEDAPDKKEWKEAREAKAQADKIRASAEYQTLEAEHRRLADEDLELSKAWHNAWFTAWQAK